MKRFVCCLLLVIHSVAFASHEDDDWDEEEYELCPTTTVEYAGISFQCPDACGNPEWDRTAQKLVNEFRLFIHRPFSKKVGLFTAEEDLPWEGLWKNLYPVGDFEFDDCVYFQQYDWEAARGEYSDRWYKSVSLNLQHSEFLNFFNTLRADLVFYHAQACKYREHQQKLREYNLEAIKVAESREYSDVDYDKITGKITHFGLWGDKTLKEASAEETYREQSIQKMTPDEDYDDAVEEVNHFEAKIDSLFREIFTYCLQHHQPEGIAFNDTLEALLYGEYEDGMARLEELIAIAEKQKFDDALIGKMLFLKGELQAEFSQHADAIISLTQALQKNPEQKDAYLERAASYFELGQFDKAIEDYLMQRDVRHFSWPQDDVDFAIGLIQGTTAGLAKACVEFVPHTLSSLHGIGQFVWTTIEDPLGSSRRIVQASINLCNTLRECSLSELATLVAPECADLVRSWNTLSPRERGERFGKIVGEGSLMVFTPLALKHGKKLMPLFKELKRGEKAAALEALSNPTTRQGMTQAAKQWAEGRNSRLSNVKLEIDKQNKHVPGERNFQDIRKRRDPKTGSEIVYRPARLKYKYPEKLVDIRFLETAEQKGLIPLGAPGSKGKVNYGFVVGTYFEGDAEIETTCAIVHFSKKGAHVVPHPPDKY